MTSKRHQDGTIPTDRQLEGCSLFTMPDAPSVPRPTSENAADRLKASGKLPTMRVRTLVAFGEAGAQGMTDRDLQGILGAKDSSSSRPRRWEAEQQGLVAPVLGVERDGCQVYAITEKGQRVLDGQVR